MKTAAGLMAVLVALGAAGLLAQGQLEYPLNRVRAKRGPNMAVQPYYVDNRVVFKKFDIGIVGEGMQIGGDLVVDLDCDRAPADSKLPSGPIIGLKIDVQLFDLTPVLVRRGGVVEDVRVDVRTQGRPVEGQSVQCRTVMPASAPDGTRLAMAEFRLPVLPRPLAPGIYNLVAALTFLSQDATQLEQIKWCGNLFGAEDQGIDPITQERITFPIIGDAKRHAQFFAELTQVQRKVDGIARIYLGNVLTGTGPVLRPAFSATERAPANYVIWDQLVERVGAVLDLEGHEAAADKDLEAVKTDPVKQANQLRLLQLDKPGATVKDLIEHWEKLTVVLKRNAKENLDMLGGKTDNNEKRYQASTVAARVKVLEQIKEFQDVLVERYWVLLDGYIRYGFHTINRPGAATFEAVKDKDRTKDAAKRDELLQQPAMANEDTYVEGLKAGSFKSQAPEIWKVAEVYLRKWPFKTVFLSRNFTKVESNKVVMDVAAWDKYRDDFVGTYLKDTDKVLEVLDTSIKYFNSVWPDLLAEARAMRDDVICLAFAYEYQIRTELTDEKDPVVRAAWQKSQIDAVLADWALKAAGAPERNLSKYHLMSQKSALAVHTQHRQRESTIKNGIKWSDFTARYKEAVEKGTALPGKTATK